MRKLISQRQGPCPLSLYSLLVPRLPSFTLLCDTGAGPVIISSLPAGAMLMSVNWGLGGILQGDSIRSLLFLNWNIIIIITILTIKKSLLFWCWTSFRFLLFHVGVVQCHSPQEPSGTRSTAPQAMLSSPSSHFTVQLLLYPSSLQEVVHVPYSCHSYVLECPLLILLEVNPLLLINTSLH